MLCTRHCPSCSPVLFERSTPVIKRVWNWLWVKSLPYLLLQRPPNGLFIQCCCCLSSPTHGGIDALSVRRLSSTKTVWLLFPHFTTRVWIVPASLACFHTQVPLVGKCKTAIAMHIHPALSLGILGGQQVCSRHTNATSAPSEVQSCRPLTQQDCLKTGEEPLVTMIHWLLFTEKADSIGAIDTATDHLRQAIFWSSATVIRLCDHC